MTLHRLLTALAILLALGLGFARPALAQGHVAGSPEAEALHHVLNEIPVSEWLGPMAPVALSPFFGITCLSGLAVWGGDWLPGHHLLLREHTALKNPAIFWTFLCLTILTSLPRFTKVSKPFAQMIDQAETFSSIITILVIRFLATNETAVQPQEVTLYQMGFVSVSFDVLLSLAIVFNIIVINSVKFFFECLIWMTPFPLLDAAFEIFNKAACLALMTLYVFSPTLATFVNFCLLAACLLVLRWSWRRIVFYRVMLFDFLLPTLFPSYGRQNRPELIVFPVGHLGPFAPRSRLTMVPSESGWELKYTHWYGLTKVHRVIAGSTPTIDVGWITNQLLITDADGTTHRLTFGFRRRHTLQEIADQLGLIIEDRKAERWVSAHGM